MRLNLLILFVFLATQAVASDWNFTTVGGADGVPLNVVTVGEASRPGILFVHGIGQSHYSFKNQLDSQLADEFFLVAFDLRGHGGSGKPWSPEAYNRPEIWAQDIAAVIEATGLSNPVMVAWSFGTVLAMDFIRVRGDDEIAGLVLTGGLGALRPYRMPSADDPKVAEFARIRELQLSRNPVDNIRASELVVDWLTATPIPASDRQIFQAFSLMFPAYARRASMSRSMDNQDLAEKLQVPTLLALGEEDISGQLEEAAVLVASHANMSLSQYEGAGHSVFYEKPQRFNDELRQFVRRVIAGDPQ